MVSRLFLLSKIRKMKTTTLFRFTQKAKKISVYLLILLVFTLEGYAQSEKSKIMSPGTSIEWYSTRVDDMWFEPEKDYVEHPRYNFTYISVDSATNKKEIIVPDSIQVSFKTTCYKPNGSISSTHSGKKWKHVLGVYGHTECPNLERIYIPASVYKISAFAKCPKLQEIDVSVGNQRFFVRDNALYENKCLHTVIPTKAGESFYLADSIESIEYQAFANCPIKDITVDEKNKSYFSKDGILYYKTDHRDFSVICLIPPARTGTLSLPLAGDSEYRVSSGALYGTSIDKIIFYNEPYNDYSNYFDFLKYFPKDRKIYAPSSFHKKIKACWPGSVQDITDLFPLQVTSNTLTSIEFTLGKSDDIDVNVEDLKLSIEGNPAINIARNGDKFTVENLSPGTAYSLVASFEESNVTRVIQYPSKLKTKTPYTYLNLKNRTQTSLTFSCNAHGDETASCEEYGVYMDGEYYKAEKGVVSITRLTPDKAYDVYLYARYEGGLSYMTSPSSFTTAAIQMNIDGQVAPTSIRCKGIYDAGDAEIVECGFNSENVDGSKLLLTGLEPNTEYSVTFFVRTKDDYSTSVAETFTTPAIELATMQPRGVSSTCSVVAAETNISEEELNVGFQWKKVDAPASLKPNEGYAAIYDGRLEGYIKNLQATSYYNVRAFYKSVAGNYYYGDWVTFDPSDFSYFEPTVHTYPVEEDENGAVKVKGYALAGTDEITEQGFEYWQVGVNGNKVKRVCAAFSPVTGASDVITVYAAGQVMTATLTDLVPGATYSVRAFVTTVSGTTYGEEQSFTTETDVTGISNAGAVTAEPVVTGYYDICGRMLNEPHKGVNIVHFSDGTARKVVVK